MGEFARRSLFGIASIVPIAALGACGGPSDDGVDASKPHFEEGAGNASAFPAFPELKLPQVMRGRGPIMKSVSSVVSELLEWSKK
jgi:hypothetical protein